ncbi:MAG: proprotein convertase P-domain-containing protein, partial [Acidobacteria bacterium]|nr:proprotein convertase P-domain-containing protein [Acidobacteriota bacterium]
MNVSLSAALHPRSRHTDLDAPRSRSRGRRVLLAGICSVVLGMTGAAQALVYSYDNTTSGTIPELTSDTACNSSSALVRTFTVPDSFTVSTIALGINLDHFNRGHIRAILNAPSGASAVFLTQSGDGDNNYDILISSNTEGAVDDNDTDPTGAPYFNRLVSLGSADFYTGDAAGTWTLRICDRNSAGGLGTFNRARLVLTSTATATSPCTSTVSYDWGANGDFAAFTSTTVGDITISQGTTTDYTGAGTPPLFQTRTSTTGAHPGWYGMAMDSPNGLDTENIGLVTNFTFSNPISALSFMAMDIDTAANSWEDQVRIVGTDSGGNRIPYSRTVGPANQAAGDWSEGDTSIPSTSSDANVQYVFAGAISAIEVEYTQGDDPGNNTSFMFIGLSDFGFCAYDFGDAPSSYNTVLGGGARHVLGSRNLYLGSTPPDGESDGQAVGAGSNNNGANGDGTDEDGVASFPSASTSAGVYTVTVAATNATGASANLCGWIDFDQGGAFDSDEAVCVTVPASGSNSTCTSTGTNTWGCTLSFTVPTSDRGNTGNFYGRFRITSDSLTTSQPGGSASDGEVEDYQIPITTLPVTLGYVETRNLDGRAEIRFTTVNETANAGFDILGRAAGGRWQRLAQVPSKADGSLRPQSYRRVVSTAGGSIDELAIVDRDYQGASRLHGPFELDAAYGEPVTTDTVDWQAVKSATGTRAPLEVVRATASPSASTGPDAFTSPFRLGGGPGSDAVGARLLIDEEGLYRVSYEQLAAAGADFAGVQTSKLALVDAGKAVQRYVDCGPVFGPGCAIEFLGRPTL